MTKKLRKDNVQENRDFKSKDWSALVNTVESTQVKRNSTSYGAVKYAGALVPFKSYIFSLSLYF